MINAAAALSLACQEHTRALEAEAALEGTQTALGEAQERISELETDLAAARADLEEARRGAANA